MDEGEGDDEGEGEGVGVGEVVGRLVSEVGYPPVSSLTRRNHPECC